MGNIRAEGVESIQMRVQENITWGSKQEFDRFFGINSIAYRGYSSERELREFAGIFKGCYGELSKSFTKGVIGCQGSHQVGVKTVNSPRGLNFSLSVHVDVSSREARIPQKTSYF